MKLMRPFIITGLTLVIMTYFLPTVNFVHWTTILIAALVITILNSLVRPILNVLFLPVNIVTLGLFSVLINVALLWLATYLVPGFFISEMTLFGYQLNQFMSLLVVSTVLGFLQGLISLIL